MKQGIIRCRYRSTKLSVAWGFREIRVQEEVSDRKQFRWIRQLNVCPNLLGSISEFPEDGRHFERPARLEAFALIVFELGQPFPGQASDQSRMRNNIALMAWAVAICEVSDL